MLNIKKVEQSGYDNFTISTKNNIVNDILLDIINYLVNEYNRRYNKDFSFVPYIYLNNEIQQKKNVYSKEEMQ